MEKGGTAEERLHRLVLILPTRAASLSLCVRVALLTLLPLLLALISPTRAASLALCARFALLASLPALLVLILLTRTFSLTLWARSALLAFVPLLLALFFYLLELPRLLYVFEWLYLLYFL